MNYMLSKLSEENTWSCNECKNINKKERTSCAVCSAQRVMDSEEDFKSAASTQRAEISYDELKKLNEQDLDNEELIKAHIFKAQEQKRKLEQVKVTQQEAEREMMKMEEDRYKGGSFRGRGGGRGGSRGSFGGYRGGPGRGSMGRGGGSGGRGGTRGRGGRGSRGRDYGGMVLSSRL